MIRRPPRSPRTYTLLPDTTLFRSDAGSVSRPARCAVRLAANELRRSAGGVGRTGRAGASIARCGFWRRARRGLGRSHLLGRSEEHTSELQSLMRISYAVFCLKKKKHNTINK